MLDAKIRVVQMKVARLVLIILRKAPIDVIRVTMCALPVQQSVTVMTGHENVRNSSKDSKNTPQERSNLDGREAC